MYRYRFEYIKDASKHGQLIEEHEIIYHAIANKDKEVAAQAVKTHIDNQEHSIIKTLQ